MPEVLDGRRDGPAWPAPGRPEIHQGGQRRLQYQRLEGRIRYDDRVAILRTMWQHRCGSTGRGRQCHTRTVHRWRANGLAEQEFQISAHSGKIDRALDTRLLLVIPPKDQRWHARNAIARSQRTFLSIIHTQYQRAADEHTRQFFERRRQGATMLADGNFERQQNGQSCRERTSHILRAGVDWDIKDSKHLPSPIEVHITHCGCMIRNRYFVVQL